MNYSTMLRLRRIHEAITSGGKSLDPDFRKKIGQDDVPDYGDEPEAPEPAPEQPQQAPAQPDTQTQDAPPEGETPPDEGTPQEGEPETTDDTGMEGDTGDESGDEGEDGDVPDYGDEGSEEGSEDDSGAGQEDMNGEEEGEAQPTGDPNEDETKALEAEVFSKLPAEQIMMMKVELKTQYIKLFESIDKSVDKLAKSNRTGDNIEVINFVTKKLIELRTLLQESLTKKFDSKTYVENKVMLERHMAVFATLTQILEESSKTLAKIKERDKSNLFNDGNLV